MSDKVALRLDNVNFWKEFIAETQKDGQKIHPKMKEKLLQAEEQLMFSLMEKHAIDNLLMADQTIH